MSAAIYQGPVEGFAVSTHFCIYTLQSCEHRYAILAMHQKESGAKDQTLQHP